MTGLQNNLHRWYNPDLGRWQSQDPIAFAGGDQNLYRYVGNSPVVFVDPSGMDRYITHFDILWLGGKAFLANVHVGVAVDVWSCVNGQWKKTGVVTYDFNVYNRYYVDVVIGGFYYYGSVQRSEGLNLNDPIRVASTPQQDREMKRILDAQLDNPPDYSFLFYNSVFWSVESLNYGMDIEPGTGEDLPPPGVRAVPADREDPKPGGADAGTSLSYPLYPFGPLGPGQW